MSTVVLDSLKEYSPMTLASNGKKKELPRQVPGYKPNPLCKKHKPETGGRIKSNEILNHDSRNAKYNYNWDAAVKLMKDWRDNGGDGNYLGMELVYNTIPGIRPVITQNKWSEMNDLDGAFCAGDLCRPSKPCPVSLELDAVSQFIADEMYLSSNHNNLLCHDGGPNHEAVSSMRVKIEYEAEHGWVTYSDSTGKEEFDCTRSASNCTVAMMPPMQAKKARLYMWCPHFNSTAYAKQMRERGKQPVVGFADHTGTKVSLKIQFKGAAHHGLKAEAVPVLSACTFPANVSAMEPIGAWTANTVNYRPGGEVLPQSMLQATQQFSLSLQGYMFVQDHGSYTLYVKSHGACKVSELCVILEWHQM